MTKISGLFTRKPNPKTKTVPTIAKGVSSTLFAQKPAMVEARGTENKKVGKIENRIAAMIAAAEYKRNKVQTFPKYEPPQPQPSPPKLSSNFTNKIKSSSLENLEMYVKSGKINNKPLTPAEINHIKGEIANIMQDAQYSGFGSRP